MYNATNTSSALSNSANQFNLGNYENLLNHYFLSDHFGLPDEIISSDPLQQFFPFLGAFSDKNLKKDVKPIHDEMEILKKLKGYEFNYSDPELPSGKRSGIMAQDLEKVMPQAVYATDKGKAVDYSQIIPVLIEAVKTLSSEIQAIKRR